MEPCCPASREGAVGVRCAGLTTRPTPDPTPLGLLRDGPRLAPRCPSPYSEIALGLVRKTHRDLKKAFKWYLKAAVRGQATAQFNLGVLYQNGLGVSKNLKEAFTWYLKAAEQGDAEAQNSVGAMYGDGRGVPKDSAQSLKWYRIAAKNGNTRAKENLAESGHSEQPETPVTFQGGIGLADGVGNEFAQLTVQFLVDPENMSITARVTLKNSENSRPLNSFSFLPALTWKSGGDFAVMAASQQVDLLFHDVDVPNPEKWILSPGDTKIMNAVYVITPNSSAPKHKLIRALLEGSKAVSVTINPNPSSDLIENFSRHIYIPIKRVQQQKAAPAQTSRSQIRSAWEAVYQSVTGSAPKVP